MSETAAIEWIAFTVQVDGREIPCVKCPRCFAHLPDSPEHKEKHLAWERQHLQHNDGEADA